MINIQNTDDNECFTWCLVKYLNPADHHPTRITKADKDFAKKPDFKDIKFPVKARDIHKIEKKRKSVGISVFGYENKVKYPIYVSKKCCEDKHVNLLLIGEGEKIQILNKDFNPFMYGHTLHRRRKHFCRYCVQAFRTAEKLKLKILLKLMVNKLLRCPRRVNILNSKFMEEK